MTARDNFEQALDQLTREIGDQKKEEGLLAAINLYQYFADLSQVFKMKIPPEFFLSKYEIMTAAAEARRKEWPAAREHIPKIEEHWDHLKIQAEGIDKKLLKQTEFSIHDLEQAIEKENANLVMIKTEIVMNNLKKFEKQPS